MDTYAQITGVWTELQAEGSIPMARAGHSTIYRSITNEIVICGGFSGMWDGYRNDIHAYNIDSNEWRQLPTAPISGYNASIYDPLYDKMIVYSYTTTSVIYEFDFSTEQWSQYNTSGLIPPELDFPSAAYNSTNHSMILHGGMWIGSNCTFSLDLDTFEWELLNVSGDLPLETKHQAAVFDLINEALIVFGGQTWPPDEDHNETFILDMNTYNWTKKDTTEPIPLARSHMGYDYSYALGKMIIMGGYVDELWPYRQNDTWLYDAQSNSWEEIIIEGDLPPGRNGHSTIYIGDSNEHSIYIFGGVAPYFVNDLWRLDFGYAGAESTICSVLTCPVDSIVVPVLIKSMDSLAKFNLIFNFDSTNISYIGFQNFNPLFNEDSLSLTVTNGSITMSLNSTEFASIESDTLIDILFFVNNALDQTIVDLIWDDINSFYLNYTGDTIDTQFINGQLTINSIPAAAGLISGTDNACQGSGELQYQTVTITNAETYTWEIVPDSAGSLTYTDTVVLINFYDSFNGDAILSVHGTNQCGDGPQSSKTISIISQPTSYAGYDDMVCEGESYLLSGNANSCTHTYWNTYGDGNFDDPFLLNANYTPGPIDIQAGYANLILIAYSISPCLMEVGDTMTLTIMQKPTAVAGENAEVCEGESYLLSGSADNYSSILWTTSGDGVFDEPESLAATYYPGPDDFSFGVVNLTLSAYPNLPCIGIEADTLELSFNYYPEQPQIPVGPIAIDLDATQTSEYTITQATNSTSYEWFLEPYTAGIIEGADTIGTVYWNSGYAGLSAYVHVGAINECGEEFSDTLGISVSPVTIKDLSIKEPEINISPNPSDGRFNIAIKGTTDDVDLIVMNSVEQIILQKKLINTIDNFEITIDISNNPTGTYYLKFVINNRNIYRKVILF